MSRLLTWSWLAFKVSLTDAEKNGNNQGLMYLPIRHIQNDE